MSDTPVHLKDRLALLVDRYLDHALSADESAELNAALLADPTARDRFVALLTTDRALAEAHRPKERIASAGRPQTAPPHADADPAPGEASGTTPRTTPGTTPYPIYRKGHEPKPSRFRPHHYAIAGIAAALFAACGVAIYLLAFNTPIAPDPAPSQPGPPVATLIHNTGDLTTPHGFPAEGDDYGRGEYTLSTGTAEFMLTNAVNVKLHGRSRMVMRNDMNVSLTRGSADFVVPKDATGFTVHLPDGSRVVDLGTAFRIKLDDQGRAHVRVSLGRVDWIAADSESASATIDAGQIAKRIGDAIETETMPVIEAVTASSGREYKIVPAGFGEDAQSHVDRNYQWNGLTEAGLPEALIDADYVMTAMDDRKRRDLRVTLELSQPATVYLLVSDHGPTPDWVKTTGFEPTDYQVGLDDSTTSPLGIGPGRGVDQRYNVWSLDVSDGSTLELGPAGSIDVRRGIPIGTYGIVVKAITQANRSEHKSPPAAPEIQPEPSQPPKGVSQ